MMRALLMMKMNGQLPLTVSSMLWEVFSILHITSFNPQSSVLPPFYPLDSISKQTQSERRQQQSQQENNSPNRSEVARKSWWAQNVCQQVQREMPSAALCSNIKDWCKVQTCNHKKKREECAGMWVDTDIFPLVYLRLGLQALIPSTYIIRCCEFLRIWKKCCIDSRQHI